MKKVKCKLKVIEKNLKNDKSASMTRKFIYFLIAIIVIGLIIIFGGKVYLAIRLLISDESFIRLTSTNQEFFVNNTDSVSGEFNIYVSSNLFCKSVCNYSLTNIASGEIAEMGIFDTSITNPTSKEYTLTAPESGEGQVLYRLEVSCSSKKTNLCKATSTPTKKSFLMALNHNLNKDQLEMRESALKKLNEIIGEDTKLTILSLENKYLYELLSKKVSTKKLNEYNLLISKNKINEDIEDFTNYKFQEVLNREIAFANKSLSEDSSSLMLEVGKYNNFIMLMNDGEDELISLISEKNMSQDDAEQILNLTRKYNILDNSFNNLSTLDKKLIEIKNILSESLQISLNLDRSKEVIFIFDNVNTQVRNLIVPNFTTDYETAFIIPSGKLTCCYENVCDTCCDESCRSNKTKYPIILLHGHSFNEGISAEKSLNDLRGIQEQLFLDGFVDGGDLTLKTSVSSGSFSRINKQVVFASSYYFDIYTNTEDAVILQTNSDNLNTYALRLNDIIKEVKLETNRDKVIIVSHSMGGLVTRRYLQIYGEGDIEKLIMVGSPNHGVDGTISAGCSVFGADKQCDDMDKDSLFINKLTYGGIPEITVENIIGVGCDMGEETGDGIVKNSSAYLDWANNYYVEGVCDGFDFLHGKLVSPKKYPEAYDLVKSFILAD